MGSDVDLVIVVKKSNRPFRQRPLDFERVHLPVPVDILVEEKGIWL